MPDPILLRDLPATEALQRARERAARDALPYAGALTPREAFAVLAAGEAVLVDVRTEPEWLYVGRAPLGVHVEWKRYGESAPNPDFIRELEREVTREQPLILMCRSGVRSHAAAAAASAAGWRAYSMLEGFEGELDDDRRRGRAGGWRAAGLDWVQS